MLWSSRSSVAWGWGAPKPDGKCLLALGLAPRDMQSLSSHQQPIQTPAVTFHHVSYRIAPTTCPQRREGTHTLSLSAAIALDHLFQ
jgi:hypothetical protein